MFLIIFHMNKHRKNYFDEKKQQVTFTLTFEWLLLLVYPVVAVSEFFFIISKECFILLINSFTFSIRLFLLIILYTKLFSLLWYGTLLYIWLYVSFLFDRSFDIWDIEEELLFISISFILSSFTSFVGVPSIVDFWQITKLTGAPNSRIFSDPTKVLPRPLTHVKIERYKVHMLNIF